MGDDYELAVLKFLRKRLYAGDDLTTGPNALWIKNSCEAGRKDGTSSIGTGIQLGIALVAGLLKGKEVNIARAMKLMIPLWQEIEFAALCGDVSSTGANYFLALLDKWNSEAP